MVKIKAVTNQLRRTTEGIVRQLSTIFDSLGLLVLLAMRSQLILQEFRGLHYQHGWVNAVSSSLQMPGRPKRLTYLSLKANLFLDDI